MKPKIVVIVGPTAVGKTDFSIELAKRFNGEIVNADSVQVYKDLNIGSAKVLPKEMHGIKHHLLDFLDPKDDYNASDYAIDANKVIRDILSRGKLPIIVGGTGMYVNSLLYKLSVECGQDKEYRSELEKIESNELHKMLEKVDSESAALIHPNHKSRIIRALEIYHLTGKPKSQHKIEETSEYDYLLLGLTMDRETLYERINRRVDIMLEQGLLDEVKGLKEKGLNKSHKSMQGIGYKETLAYINGEYSFDEYREKLKQNSRNYAKRQLTYFKKMQNIKMIEAKNIEKNIKLVEDFING